MLKNNLVDPKNILLPPLHIKLGLMKQLVKALLKMGIVFNIYAKKFHNFPKLSSKRVFL